MERREPLEVPVDVEVGLGREWEVTFFRRGGSPEEDVFASKSYPVGELAELERFLEGGSEEFDPVFEAERAGVDDPFLIESLHRLGLPVSEKALAAAQKFIEDQELTEEEWAAIEGEREKYDRPFLLRWDPGRVRWTPEAESARRVAGARYTYGQLMAMGREELDRVARLKGVSATGRKEEVAMRVAEHDRPKWYEGTVFERFMRELPGE
jgi:hypothetical protein